MHLYTSRYIENGIAEEFVIPEEYRGDGKGQQIIGMSYKSSWGMRIIELFLDSGKVKIRDEYGLDTTDYTYVSFEFIWFI